MEKKISYRGDSYEVTKGDTEGNTGAPFLAARFGVSQAALLRANANKPFHPGAWWVIPFDHDPNEGWEYYAYDIKRGTVVELWHWHDSKDKIVMGREAGPLGSIDDAIDREVFGATSWNRVRGTYGRKAVEDRTKLVDNLWLMWCNRDFRTWQVKNKGTPGKLVHARDGASGTTPDPELLWLPYRKAVLQLPKYTAPTSSSDPSGSPTTSVPANVSGDAELAFLALTDELVAAGSRLEAALELRMVAVNDVQRVLMNSRALSALADKLVARLGSDVKLGYRRRVLGDLREKANAFDALLNKKIPQSNPLVTLAPDIMDRPAEIAHGIHRKLKSQATIDCVKRFRDVVPATPAKEVMVADHRRVQALIMWLSEQTAAFDSLVQTAEIALSGKSPDSSVYATLVTFSQVPSNTGGNLPGLPDSLSVALHMLSAKRTLLRDVNAGLAASKLNQKLKPAVIAAAGLNATEAEALGKAIDQMIVDKADIALLKANRPSDHEAIMAKDLVRKANRKVADEILDARFARCQTHVATNIFIEALTLMQLIAALESSDDIPEKSIGDYANTGSLALQAIGGAPLTIGSMHKWVAGRASAGNLAKSATVRAAPRPIDPGIVKARLAVLPVKIARWAAAAPTTALTQAIPVLNIISGMDTALDGWSTDSKIDMGVGGLNILAGVCLLIPGAQPVGSILAYVALVISVAQTIADLHRPMTEKVYESLLRRLRALTMPAPSSLRLMDALGEDVREAFEALCDANNEARVGDPTQLSNFFLLGPDPASRKPWPEQRIELVQELETSLGLKDPSLRPGEPSLASKLVLP